MSSPAMNPHPKYPLTLWLLLPLLLCTPPALAEKADRTRPVNLEADSVTVDDQRKTSVYLGNVVLLQGTMMLRADKIEVRQDAEGFNKATAYGNPVSFRQKRDGVEEYIEGYAGRIEYDGRQSRLELFGNARLKRGEDELHGNYISYNANTEFFEVKGADSAAAKPPAGRPERVRAVLRPKSATPPAPAGAPLPLKPASGIQP